MKPETVYYKTNYTIYSRSEAERMIVYFHPQAMAFPHSNGKKGRTLYNYQEEVAQQIFDKNEDAIVAVGKYSNDFISTILNLIRNHHIDHVVVSGWSMAGNDAIKACNQLLNVKRLILIDANHTDQLPQKAFDNIRGVSLEYVSNVYSPAKLKHITKAVSTLDYPVFIKLNIPKGFSGSNHRYCRDWVLNRNLYGWLIGGDDFEVIDL